MRSLVETVGKIAKDAAETAAEKVRTVKNQNKDVSENVPYQIGPASESTETAAGDGEGEPEKAETSASSEVTPS